MLKILSFGVPMPDTERTADIRLPKNGRILNVRIIRRTTLEPSNRQVVEMPSGEGIGFFPVSFQREVIVEALVDLDQPRAVRRLHILRNDDELAESLYWKLKFLQVIAADF